MHKINFFLILLSIAASYILPTQVEAHRDGCHAAHSCPSDTGSYVCGDLGNYSECGNTAPPAEAAPPPTSAKVKQFVAPIATKVPVHQPTSTPTVQPTAVPTLQPTSTPIQQAKVVPTIAVAGETNSDGAVGGLITLGIISALGYLGYKKFKSKKSSPPIN